MPDLVVVERPTIDVMSTDKQAVDEPASTSPSTSPSPTSLRPTRATAADDVGDDRQPSWWHRDHPTFAALTGFFTGLLFVALVPAMFVGVLSLLVRQRPRRGPVPVRAGHPGRPARRWSSARAPAGSAPTSRSGWSSPRSSWSASALWCCGTWSRTRPDEIRAEAAAPGLRRAARPQEAAAPPRRPRRWTSGSELADGARASRRSAPSSSRRTTSAAGRRPRRR